MTDWKLFRVGDRVTRGDGDVHRIDGINDAGDLIDVTCTIPPRPWAKVGETESNVAWRYEPVGVLIDLDRSQWRVL